MICAGKIGSSLKKNGSELPCEDGLACTTPYRKRQLKMTFIGIGFSNLMVTQLTSAPSTCQHLDTLHDNRPAVNGWLKIEKTGN